MKLTNVSQMQNLDESAIADFGIPEEILMENAALSTCEVIRRNINLEDKSILVVAGIGNNGGDGLAIARKLSSGGNKIEILLMNGSDNYKNAARLNYEIIKKLHIKTYDFDKIDDISIFLNSYHIIIDGIFGIALDRNVEGKYFEIISAINDCNCKVISLDIPSGLCSNTGLVMGIAIKANYTISYGALKYGNIMGDASEYSGKLYLSDISIPESLTHNLKVQLVNLKSLPKRGIKSHKGSYGKVLFIGGGNQYYGAPYFNSVAFLKAGGSYSRLACPNSLVKSLAIKSNEIVYFPMKESINGNLSIENLKTLLDMGNNMNLVALGCGMSIEEEAKRLAQLLISKLEIPLIIDADGLNALSEKTEILLSRKNLTILTPHIGEMSKLTGLKVEEIERNPIDIAREFARKYKVILVLKGHRTVIAYPNGTCQVNTSGNSSLAVAGSGDILTGIIAGLFSLGCDLEDAASLGVFIHGYCGDLLKEDIGEDGVLAEDILNILPYAMKYYRVNFEDIKKIYDIEKL